MAGFLIVAFCLLVLFSYIEKFTDFLRLFVSVHLRRIETYSQFPVVEFLTLLFKYTFHQVKLQNSPSLPAQKVYFVIFGERTTLFSKHLSSAYYVRINTFPFLTTLWGGYHHHHHHHHHVTHKETEAQSNLLRVIQFVTHGARIWMHRICTLNHYYVGEANIEKVWNEGF